MIAIEEVQAVLFIGKLFVEAIFTPPDWIYHVLNAIGFCAAPFLLWNVLSGSPADEFG